MKKREQDSDTKSQQKKNFIRQEQNNDEYQENKDLREEIQINQQQKTGQSKRFHNLKSPKQVISDQQSIKCEKNEQAQKFDQNQPSNQNFKSISINQEANEKKINKKVSINQDQRNIVYIPQQFKIQCEEQNDSNLQIQQEMHGSDNQLTKQLLPNFQNFEIIREQSYQIAPQQQSQLKDQSSPQSREYIIGKIEQKQSQDDQDANQNLLLANMSQNLNDSQNQGQINPQEQYLINSHHYDEAKLEYQQDQEKQDEGQNSSSYYIQNDQRERKRSSNEIYVKSYQVNQQDTINDQPQNHDDEDDYHEKYESQTQIQYKQHETPNKNQKKKCVENSQNDSIQYENSFSEN